MTVREKLIELLRVPIYPHELADPAEVVADYLLDNGLIFATDNNVGSKWIPVTERLPTFTSERRRSVLVTLEDRQGKRLVTTAKYNPEYEEWYEFKDSRFYDFKVLAWMPKPERYEPPKEETNGRSDC